MLSWSTVKGNGTCHRTGEATEQYGTCCDFRVSTTGQLGVLRRFGGVGVVRLAMASPAGGDQNDRYVKSPKTECPLKVPGRLFVLF